MTTIRAALFTGALAACAAGAPRALAIELTLQDAIRWAVTQHRTVRNAALAIEGEALGVETARSDFDLKIVPNGRFSRIGSNSIAGATGTNASLGVQLERRFETGTVIAVGPSFNRFADQRNTTLAVSLQQPLLRGWDRDLNLDSLRGAEHSLASSRRAFEAGRQNVALEAIGAYYAVMRERRMAAFAAAQYRRIEQHARVAEAKERSGIIGAMDVYRAGIRLKDAEDALNQATVAESAALNRLRRALDLPLNEELALREPPADAPELADLEHRVVEVNIEIRQLRGDLAEAQRQAMVARKRVWPDVTLNVSAGQTSQVDPFLVQFVPTTQRQWNVSLQASSDLRRTAERNAWRRAQLQAQAMQALLEAKVEEMRRQVRDQRLALQDARRRIALREDQIRQAEARLALAQVKFAHDMASNVDVMDTEAELQRAEASLAGARADLAVGVYQLRALAGALLEDSQ